ncbi:MAG: hypothetical protein JNK82_08045 [Myxococcaceae bacterium]|nr:hypothetical protein [Myxococcaceae bacterium]
MSGEPRRGLLGVHRARLRLRPHVDDALVRGAGAGGAAADTKAVRVAESELDGLINVMGSQFEASVSDLLKS